MRYDVVRHGSTLRSIRTRDWLTPRDIKSHLVVLIHGFASNGDHLKRFGRFVQAHGNTVALYEYDGHRGFDDAAVALVHKLTSLEDAIADCGGFSLIGHSMGGLVARWATTMSPAQLKAVVLLGTPNAGVLSHPWVISAAIRAGEWLSRADPYARSLGCEAALQLTQADADAAVGTLNATHVNPVPMLSISGGMPFLEVGRSAKSNALLNRILQSLIGEAPNDGLVGESSADITRHVAISTEHCADYSEFSRTNHLALPLNHEVALQVVKWLSKHHP
jgi:pimeloyl-ACP methyl ester carboxylesterase